jgi:hypothetical protein
MNLSGDASQASTEVLTVSHQKIFFRDSVSLRQATSLMLSSPPYNFKPSMVGPTYLGACLGIILGVLYIGPFGTWFCD